jgi:hypothetical protein
VRVVLGAGQHAVGVEARDDPGRPARRSLDQLLGQLLEHHGAHRLVAVDGAEQDRRGARPGIAGRRELERADRLATHAAAEYVLDRRGH